MKMAKDTKKTTTKSNEKMGKARDAMKDSPQVRKASAAEDAAMKSWMSLKASKESSKADVDKAYKKYITLARKRAKTAEAKITGFSKGGVVKKESGYAKGGMVKANCGASMKPTQRKK